MLNQGIIAELEEALFPVYEALDSLGALQHGAREENAERPESFGFSRDCPGGFTNHAREGCSSNAGSKHVLTKNDLKNWIELYLF